MKKKEASKKLQIFKRHPRAFQEPPRGFKRQPGSFKTPAKDFTRPRRGFKRPPKRLQRPAKRPPRGPKDPQEAKRDPGKNVSSQPNPFWDPQKCLRHCILRYETDVGKNAFRRPLTLALSIR